MTGRFTGSRMMTAPSLHAQCGRRVDPVPLPPGCTQFRVHRLGVVPALAGDEDGQLREFGDVVRVEQGTRRSPDVRFLAALGGSGEEHRVDEFEVASARIRSISTEPTMPRHPMMPAWILVVIAVLVCFSRGCCREPEVGRSRGPALLSKSRAP